VGEVIQQIILGFVTQEPDAGHFARPIVPLPGDRPLQAITERDDLGET
jgi:hypothetical protein